MPIVHDNSIVQKRNVPKYPIIIIITTINKSFHNTYVVHNIDNTVAVLDRLFGVCLLFRVLTNNERRQSINVDQEELPFHRLSRVRSGPCP